MTKPLPAPEDVRAFLRDHPDFILRDPELMKALLRPAHRDGRKVVDFQSALVDRLEARLNALAEAHRDIIESAYENMESVTRIHQAAVALIQAEDFDSFLEVTAERLRSLLSVDEVRLVLEAHVPLFDDPAIVTLPPGTIYPLMKALRAEQPDPLAAIVLRGPTVGETPFFGDVAAEIKSEALVPLDFGRGLRPGLLVFGARDPKRFHPEQGDHLLAFLGAVVAGLMGRWLRSA